MSGQVVIYGSSDDLIEIEGACKGCDEYNEDDATFVLIGGEARTLVHVRYADFGVWAITVSLAGEDIPMLPVAITGSGYTAKATIEGVDLVIHEAP